MRVFRSNSLGTDEEEEDEEDEDNEEDDEEDDEGEASEATASLARERKSFFSRQSSCLKPDDSMSLRSADTLIVSIDLSSVLISQVQLAVGSRRRLLLKSMVWSSRPRGRAKMRNLTLPSKSISPKSTYLPKHFAVNS